MQQWQSTVSPQYGQTHLQLSIGSPQVWHRGSAVFFFNNSRLYTLLLKLSN
jgi:hypothetical protein